MSAPPAQRTLSTLVSADGVRSRITQNDLLWLAKMAGYEGGVDSSPALLWALAQRYVWADRSKFPTLAALAQAFSQPINPIWRRDGSECREGGTYHGRDDCNENALARRDRAAAASWSSLDGALTDVVGAWGQGKVLNPVPTAANWGSSTPRRDRTLSKGVSYLQTTPGAKLVLTYGGNMFIAERKTKEWPDDHVALWNRDGSITTTVLTPAPFFASLARGIGRGLSVV
jgi:hypothetical protein